MTPEDMDKILDRPEVISGIHNYCDRWCERCPFTRRCAVFLMEEAAGLTAHVEDPEAAPPDMEASLEHMKAMFAATREKLETEAKEQGLDWDQIVAEAKARRPRRPKKPPAFMKAVRGYGMAAIKWLRSRRPAFEARGRELAAALEAGAGEGAVDATLEAMHDALKVVEWYMFQIEAKLRRALPDPLDDEGDEDDAEGRDGSAKVALLALDASIEAWTILREHLPGEGDAILDHLATLSRIRAAAEKHFPKARAFARPGFDDPRFAELVKQFRGSRKQT
jgi:hypothetical protein